MSNNRFDDAVLSAIIDGEADDELVASVEADAEAIERLSGLRQAVQIVGEEPAPATPERRSASIAAAMARRYSGLPRGHLTGCSRHEKAEKKRRSIPTAWVAAAAAAVALVVAIPLALSLDGGDTETFATADVAEAASDDAADVVEESAAAESAAVDDAADDVADAMDDDAMADDAMADDAMADDAAMEEDAMEEEVNISGDAEDSAAEATDPTTDDIAVPTTTTTVPAAVDVQNFSLTDLPIVSTPAKLEQAIDEDQVIPLYTADEVIIAGVREDCITASDNVTAATPYALVTLSPFGGADRLIVVEFADNGVTRALDAEDCALLG